MSLRNGSRNLSMLLLKGLYKWCLSHRVRYMYAVADEGASRHYRSLGLPLASIGEPVRMSDGIASGAFILDWREFERSNSEKDPGLLEWFSS